jgi:hypothetical protein
MCKKNFMRFIIVIKQIQVTIATKCLGLTRRMKVSDVVGHNTASSYLFRYIVSIL